MAPGSSSPLVDLRAQVIENCEFFSEPHARISLVIAKEPLGTFKAIVLRTKGGIRTVLLSETAPSFYDALQALHVKSAEAVQNYIGANGFALPPSSGNRRSSKHAGGGHDDGHDSDSAASTVTLDDCESLSDDETVSIAPVRREKRSHRKADKSAKTSTAKHKQRHGRTRARSPSSSRHRARSRSTGSSSSDSELHYNPPPIPSHRPPFLNGFAQRLPPRPAQNAFSTMAMGPLPPLPPPPPPPPGPQSRIQRGHLAPGYINIPPPPPRPFFPFHNNQSNNNNNNKTPFTVPPPPLPLPPTTQTTITPAPTPTPTPTTMHDIILQIHWRHHGERRTLEQTPQITIARLQHAALAFVRRQAAGFVHVPSPQQDLPGYYRAALAGLKAAVRSVVVDGVAYDLTGGVQQVGAGGGGGNLTRLVEALSSPSSSSSEKGAGMGLPRFEVEGCGGGDFGNGGGVSPVLVRQGSGSGSGSGLGQQQQQQPGAGAGPPPRMVFPLAPGGLSNHNPPVYGQAAGQPQLLG
ncbi:hypothetical protein C8A00DRAFT_42173 [Chaetomidium leptoderma]|uniref:Uncharacterized protein n=1 Tax=Chaetomidium leptoderma TaxID=669021 RepID=A0AAN6VQ24_9PEZI|nr:hypothetical protein C8A00DRAFT_42173 [Chaetomidium leptoderma]